MSNPASILEEATRTIADDESDRSRKTAIVTGSVALGAVLTSSLFRRLRHLKLKAPQDLAPALNADTSAMEIMEGRARFYQRPGAGVPILLLHGIHAAASSFEMKPVFEHLEKETSRPLFALDWFGFGRSDRPPVRYAPALYSRQLRRFLSEHVHQPADIVALSMASEYTAEIARSLPYLVRRLVLVSPTGLTARQSSRAWRKTVISLSDSVGAFEIFYYRLTRPELLRRFYERQIFRGDVPDELVEQARATTVVLGAHHAPRYFIQGDLSTGRTAFTAYARLPVPTMVIVPEDDAELFYRFELLPELEDRNPEFIQSRRLPSGLMPQWEVPYHLFDAVDSFLTS